MVSSALLTYCVAMTCYIVESEVDYNIVSASNSVHMLKNELTAARARLHGFSEWVLSKTDSDIWDMLGGMDETVNPPLQKIRKTVDEAIAEGKDTEHCYTTAHASAKELAKIHLDLVMPCIENFKKAVEATLIDIPDRLHDINKLTDDIVTILPDCELRMDKGACMWKRLNNVTSPILDIESFARIVVERGHGDYSTQHTTAVRCLTRRFDDLYKKMSLINSEANECVRKS